MTAIAADSGYAVIYDGGSLPGIKTGTKIRMYLEGDKIRFANEGKAGLDLSVISAASVTEVSYGQDVHRRVGAAIGLAIFSLGLGALLALSKSKKHFVGLTWADGDKKGGFAMQCDKSDYRGILAGLEGVTGKKAVDSDALTVKN
ncbi:MAG TPA: hypothetical protein VHX60_00225 [Acidobacteriaceae bacterium]|jgi:hypothetical protein|nr:hypothetical protein [Acidobacteriaceae bacterium]